MPTVTGASADLYAILGIDASVGGDEIARAFRNRAKQLHPDTSEDPEAASKFNELVAAYGILSNHRTRREYDAGRARPAPGLPVDARGTAAPAPAERWTRRRAWTALVGGALVALLGIAGAWLTWHLHESDAQQRAHFLPVTASRVANGDIAFITTDGLTVETREPELHGEGSNLGPTVRVRYDPANPIHVILDSSTAGRDITLAIVSLKFLICGPVFVVLGGRRLRRLVSASRE